MLRTEVLLYFEPQLDYCNPSLPTFKMSFQTIVKSPLRSVLKTKLSSLKQSPMIIICSKPANEEMVEKHIGSVVQKATFHASMEFNLKVVSSTISSAFPTISDVDRCMEMAQRAGAGTVLAVGSGVCIDLAKIVVSQYPCDELILVPATSGGILASTTDRALLLDTHEETLCSANQREPTTTKAQATTLVIDDITHHKYAQQSALAIAIDALWAHTRSHDDDPASQITATTTVQLALDGNLTGALLSAGPLLSYGNNTTNNKNKGQKERSPILTLATSLIPTVYSNSHIMEFWASTLPGQINNYGMPTAGMLTEQYVDRLKQVQAECPKLAEMSMENLPLSKLMEYIRDNQALWNTADVSDAVLEAVLETSLNR